MTREEGKELLPIIQAWVEGKTIQYFNVSEDKWCDIPSDADVTFSNEPCDYRIKTEQKYRPFKTKEECFEEMHKHSDFGWIRYDDSITAIINIAPDGITVNNGIETSSFYFEECLENITFVDETPFGIKI